MFEPYELSSRALSACRQIEHISKNVHDLDKDQLRRDIDAINCSLDYLRSYSSIFLNIADAADPTLGYSNLSWLRELGFDNVDLERVFDQKIQNLCAALDNHFCDYKQAIDFCLAYHKIMFAEGQKKMRRRMVA